MATQYFTATSLDGFIADENNSLEWLFEADRDNTGDTSFARFFEQVGAIAMGAATYLWLLEHERMLEEPAKWHVYYGNTPSWVFTHRPLPKVPGAEITFVQGDVGPVHARMKAAGGDKNIWIAGGGELVGQFADARLLDEIFLTMAPVTLGRGAPLLPRRLGSSDLELIEVARDRQFVKLHYRLRK